MSIKPNLGFSNYSNFPQMKDN